MTPQLKGDPSELLRGSRLDSLTRYGVGLALLFATACNSTSAPDSSPRAAAQLEQVVIAHRGASYWAPEMTRAAYTLARDLGSDYLEADIQRTRDGVLVCVHDKDLARTTDVADLFPDRAQAPVSEFDWKELERLEAGAWFNRAYPERARPQFDGEKILTLNALIDIAEAARGKKPGLCLEIKRREHAPGIEADLKALLARRGWDGRDPDRPLLLQTFDRFGLQLLAEEFPEPPKVLLLWEGEGSIPPDDLAAYESWLDDAVALGAQYVGPSVPGPPYHFADLLKPEMVAAIRARRLGILPYTANTLVTLQKYLPQVNGFFTDRPELLLDQYERERRDIESLLKR